MSENNSCESNDESKEEMEFRGERMVELLNGAKGMNLKNLPVPPLTKWLNGQIVYAKRGEVVVDFLVRPEMANPTKLLHGGMHCAMMDDTIGICTATLGYKGFLITIDFHVDYLGKVRVGEKVLVKAKIVREGKRVVHADSEIKDKDGEIVSTAQANLLITHHSPDFNKMVDKEN